MIAAVSIITWIITDFFGGMFIWLFSYPIIILPVCLLYIFSFFQTIILTIKNGIKQNKIRIIAHLLVVITIIGVNLYNSEIFKPKKLFSATLYDDLCYYNFIFREKGIVENEIDGFLGYREIFKGKYHFLNDSIIVFDKMPYKNDFFKDTMLIDQQQQAIFMYKDSSGNFTKETSHSIYFQLNEQKSY